MCESKPAESFSDFVTGSRHALENICEAAVGEQNEWRDQRMEFGGKPLQSVFTKDCIETGRDIDRGGARYNWVECSFVGLANLADSLHVIQKEVYETNRISLPEMKAILDTDYEGHEAVRQRWLNSLPKYGNDQEDVDRFIQETVDFCKRECAKHRILPDDSPFVPGAFCWIMHEQLGRVTGATPTAEKRVFRSRMVAVPRRDAKERVRRPRFSPPHRGTNHPWSAVRPIT